MIRNLLVMPTGEELFSGKTGENALAGVTVTRCVNSEEELTPGAVCASMLEASVIVQKPLALCAGDEVMLYTVSDDNTRKLEGVFVAEKPVWESANRYSLTAYDRISKLDKDLTHWLANLTGWPYSLLDFASMVCSECGLELITQQIPNGDYSVQAFSGEGITGRQIIQWAGQASGRFCRATADGKIEFAWYQKTAKNIGPEEKNIQTGSASFAILEEMTANTQLQAVSEITPSDSGCSKVTLKRCGKNLFNPQAMVDLKKASFDQTTGLWTVDTKKLSGTTAYFASLISSGVGQKGTRDVSRLIKVPPNTPITITIRDWSAVSTNNAQLIANESYMGYGWYYADGTCYNAGHLNTGPVKTIVSPDIEPCYLDIRRNDAAILVSFSSIQIELGSNPTDYEPYREMTLRQDFEETVYGGSFDWNTGLLTVTDGKDEEVHTLESPYTVQLTPRQIEAMDGVNYLWSDTGNTKAGFRQDYYFSGGLSYEDYQVAPVEKVQIRLTDDDIGAIFPDEPEAKNTYILSGNYLLTGSDAECLKTVAQNLYEELKDISYTPCKIELPASVNADAGDILTVTDRNGKAFFVFVMSRTREGQRDRLEATGSPRRDSVSAVNSQSYKALSGKVLELQTDVEGLQAVHREAQGDFSKLALTVEGITTEVTRQQTAGDNLARQITSVQQTAEKVSVAVQEIQENGVSKVKTQMGYTFDDEGLKISRAGGEMSNLLDNTGMYVRRGNDTVLQANNEGVEAINITVRNYLTVGKHTRLEDYNNGKDSKRTACFFVGG